VPYAGLNDSSNSVMAKVPVVCITGPSGVGKTRFTLALAEALGAIEIEVLVICCDNYYKQHGQPHPRFGFDTLEAIDIHALRAELDQVTHHTASSLRTYDMSTRDVARKPLNQSYQLVLLEGAYGPQDLLDDGSITALFYLEAPLLLRMIRRLRRDRQERGRKPIQIIQHMVMHMIPGEWSFIRPLRSVSALVITNPRQGQIAAIELIQALMTESSAM
jgi:uridine kinase